MLLPEIKSKRVLMDDEKLEQTKNIFRQFMRGGYSIRRLGQIHNIPWTTLRDRFKRIYGQDYTCRSGGEGSIHNIIKEYLNWEQLEESERDYLENWYENNIDFLLEESYNDQSNNDIRYYTENKLYRDSCYQISLREDISSKVIKDERYSPVIEDTPNN